jgi:hypothetical protein
MRYEEKINAREPSAVSRSILANPDEKIKLS